MHAGLHRRPDRHEAGIAVPHEADPSPAFFLRREADRRPDATYQRPQVTATVADGHFVAGGVGLANANSFRGGARALPAPVVRGIPPRVHPLFRIQPNTHKTATHSALPN